MVKRKKKKNWVFVGVLETADDFHVGLESIPWVSPQVASELEKGSTIL